MHYPHESGSHFVSKGPCENCGSSDANALYDDEHTHCFSCGHTVQPNGVSRPAESRGGRDVPADLLRGEYRALGKRGIAEETCRKYGYLVGKDRDGEPVQIATYCDSAGSPVAQKLRTPDKKFVVVGKLKEAGLFGQHLYRSKGKRVIVTEGEIDCLSVAQALSLKWPVVSVPNGAQGAAKSLAAQLDWLAGFEEIVLWFDNDEPGRKAVEACATILPPGRVKFVTTPFDLKDANDLLREHGPTAVVNATWEAKDYRPDGIVGKDELTLESLLEPEPPGWLTPYPALNALTKGIRPRQLWLLTAGSGVGKSTDAREWAYKALLDGMKVGMVFLEESVRDTAKHLIALDNDVPASELRDDPTMLTPEQWAKSHNKLIAHGRYLAYDHFGSVDGDNLIGKLTYLAAQGCKLIFVDHISIAVSGLDMEEGERRAIDKLMTNLRSLCERLDVSIIAISHLRKTGGQGRSFEEGGQISLDDLRGSGALKQLSDVVVAKERNQQAEDGESDYSDLRLLKCRYTGRTGLADRLKYDRATGRIRPVPRDQLEVDESAEVEGEF
ncbi:DnaB-like helicase C-terminal domain-containing protein [Burkholderia multivorans]|uniref:DnaB-like helicase C-terminal domain-containing protein n=1 Tax=Burkholderia multivorans TaxID=87883 RepID=UPI0009C1959D|nr:DnaB-like helicase C-terminal domain-containing protein [Burkholderia multivorans]